MGRYFLIGNNTKKQIVKNGSYWKADAWCDCYQVMHQYGWDKTDDIFTESDDNSHYKLVYDSDLNILEQISIDITELSCENDEKQNEINIPFQVDNFCYNEVICGYKKYSELNHIPEWDGKKCKICQYIQNKSNL